MTDPTQPLEPQAVEQHNGPGAGRVRRLASNRALQVLVAVLVLLLAAVPGVLLLTTDEAAQPQEPEPEPAELAEATEDGGDRGADERDPQAGEAVTPAPAAQDAPAQPQDDPAGPPGCPQPGVPARDFDATTWQGSDELYIHVHPEQWYVSAWCATEAVAQSLGADGWRVSNASDSGALAHLVRSGLADDSVFAVEYEVKVLRDARGWYLGSEHATERFWCLRGVDPDNPGQCL